MRWSGVPGRRRRCFLRNGGPLWWTAPRQSPEVQRKDVRVLRSRLCWHRRLIVVTQQQSSL